MSSNIRYFKNIKLDPPIKKILFRLGYKNKKTQINNFQKKKILFLIKKANELCENRVLYMISNFKIKYDSIILIDDKIKIMSKNLSEILKDCKNIIFLFSTVGNKIIKKRDFEIKSGDALYGVILDAVASEITDALLDWIEKYLKFFLLRKNEYLTKRFSPGYGDLNLSVQKKIYNILKLKKLGIKINKKNMLIPEKSVIAIAGIKVKK